MSRIPQLSEDDGSEIYIPAIVNRKRGRKRVWILDIDKVRRFLISVKYHAVSKLLKRFETRLRSEAELKAVLSEIHGRLNV